MARPWKLVALLATGLLLTSSSALRGQAPSAQEPVYKNANAPVDQRVNDLLGRMNLDEKIAQLCGIWPPDQLSNGNDEFDPAKADQIMKNGVCTIGPFRLPLAKEIPFRNAIQKYLMEKTRLGIPVIFHDEGCHGVSAPNATSFPVPIGLACSWDPQMIEQIYTTVAKEMRARGSQFTLAPIVDIDQDPRWGRTDEMMGEDPYLNGKLGAAMVFGFQGHDYPADNAEHVAATLKHLTGHGSPAAGINRAPSISTRREILDQHVLAFRIAIADSNPYAVMPSYNEIDGVPSHTNKWLLQDVLRDQLGFKGLIASDYDGIKDLDSFHHVAADLSDAALQAWQAGVEIDLPNGASYSHLKGLVESGKIPMSEVDARVKTILTLKFQTGLFEHPYTDEEKAVAVTKLESSKKLALEAAQKSIVLLTNKNNILPLAKDKYKTIAVVGPNADYCHLGSYPGVPWYTVSVLQGIKEKVGDAAKVLYAEGCKITTNNEPTSLDGWRDILMQTFPTREQNEKLMAEAVDTAKQADLIVLVVGENEMLCRESWAPDHIGDLDKVELFGDQQELADKMLALGKPVVVYLMNGRPLAIPEIADKADAVIEGWYMGQETGHAAADVLFGDVNPSGHLTISFPRHTGDLPVYYNHKPSAHSFNYVGRDTNTPLFPFGYGLSYTTFAVSDVKVADAKIAKDGSTKVTATITNTGNRAGDTVAQFYIHDKVSSVTRPVKELRGFQRVSLKAGESKTVSFDVTPDRLRFHDINMNYVVEPGDFDLMVGLSSDDVKTVNLNVTD